METVVINFYDAFLIFIPSTWGKEDSIVITYQDSKIESIHIIYIYMLHVQALFINGIKFRLISALGR